MRRTVVVAMAVGLLAGMLAAPADAQRRPRPVDRNYYLTNEAGECGEGNYQLKLQEATSGASCGNFLSGPGNEALVQAGDEPAVITYRAVEGVPFLLNARRNVRGTIYVASFALVSAGPTTLSVEVGGTTRNQTVVIAEDEIDYIVTPGTQEVELDIEIPNRFNNRRFTGLHVGLYNRGVAPLHGWYSTNSPASFLTMPILRR